jgi:hypothetical protein
MLVPSFICDPFVDGTPPKTSFPQEHAMKVFLSSTYNDLIEHHQAAPDENHPRMGSRTFGE